MAAAVQTQGYNSEKVQTPCPCGSAVAPRIVYELLLNVRWQPVRECRAILFRWYGQEGLLRGEGVGQGTAHNIKCGGSVPRQEPARGSRNWVGGEQKQKTTTSEVPFCPLILGFSPEWFGFFVFFCFCFCFCLFAFSRAAPAAYGGSQARGPMGTVVACLRHSHSNAGPEPCLGPTPQLTATPDP